MPYACAESEKNSVSFKRGVNKIALDKAEKQGFQGGNMLRKTTREEREMHNVKPRAQNGIEKVKVTKQAEKIGMGKSKVN